MKPLAGNIERMWKCFATRSFLWFFFVFWLRDALIKKNGCALLAFFLRRRSVFPLPFSLCSVKCFGSIPVILFWIRSGNVPLEAYLLCSVYVQFCSANTPVSLNMFQQCSIYAQSTVPGMIPICSSSVPLDTFHICSAFVPSTLRLSSVQCFV